MGADPNWIFWTVSPEVERKIRTPFDRALKKAKSKRLNSAILRKWSQCVTVREATNIEDIWNPFFNDNFSDLALQFAEGRGPMDPNAMLADVFAVSMRLPPALAAWLHLGPSVALGLPGYCGNLLVPRSDVEECLRQVTSKKVLATEKFLDVTAGLFGDEYNVDEWIRALPRALKLARKVDCGILSLTLLH